MNKIIGHKHERGFPNQTPVFFKVKKFLLSYDKERFHIMEDQYPSIYLSIITKIQEVYVYVDCLLKSNLKHKRRSADSDTNRKPSDSQGLICVCYAMC